ncbi:hypothetical protein PHYSODRAFT_337163 [Phytophthora sojae]|uniref:Uncharacterized protein n=1 Tax=Phytophthora sojae (strain P6497) TaxID=1094619 RepID=G4ZZE2_PHYSP|nr:hypothetical protein PHYSODRAFT_337163 [Phytophthora sojae]EGZ10342.1 hypothetical protein PHYSODRAFT_337163 [Phytophthora sojae]|eukprot:XP_009533087.1 hypothetical protein PHYSODRAFT_337163 [Phytophthora sojae]
MPGTDATDDTDGMPNATTRTACPRPRQPKPPEIPDTDDTDGMPKPPEIPGTDSMLGVLPNLGSVSLCAVQDGPGKQSTIEAPDIPGTNAMPTTSSSSARPPAAPDLLDTDPMPADPKHPQYGRHVYGFDQARNGLHARGPVRPGADLMQATTDQPDSGCMPILYYIDLDSTLAVPAKPDTERTFVAIDNFDNFDTDGTPAPL